MGLLPLLHSKDLDFKSLIAYKHSILHKGGKDNKQSLLRNGQI